MGAAFEALVTATAGSGSKILTPAGSSAPVPATGCSGAAQPASGQRLKRRNVLSSSTSTTKVPLAALLSGTPLSQTTSPDFSSWSGAVILMGVSLLAPITGTSLTIVHSLNAGVQCSLR